MYTFPLKEATTFPKEAIEYTNAEQKVHIWTLDMCDARRTIHGYEPMRYASAKLQFLYFL